MANRRRVSAGRPRLHGTRLDSIPAASSYLHADPDSVRRGRPAWRPWSRVASAGSASPGPAVRPTNNDLNRSASLAALAPLGEIPGVALISLQKGPPKEQVGAWYRPAPLLNLGPDLTDFADTAGLLACLDLVIAVDTAVGHLAAALGRPTWLLLPYARDWRWLLGRADCPWYPGMRLFRQPAPQDWPGVVAEVAAALAA